MLLRKAFIAALVVAPFVYSPSAVSAQQGLDRAAVASSHAQDVGAGQNSHANQDMPAGVARRFEGQTLPPGISRTRSQTVEPTADDGGADDGTVDDGSGTTEPVCIAWDYVWEGFSYTEVCIAWQ